MAKGYKEGFNEGQSRAKELDKGGSISRAIGDVLDRGANSFESKDYQKGFDSGKANHDKQKGGC